MFVLTMQFTEEDVPLMKLIFNPETHAMGMLVGRDRAKEIFEYVCNEVRRNKENFIRDVSDFFERILRSKAICDFFWDDNILNINLIRGYEISWLLRHSPIAEKIWDSGKLDLTKLNTNHIFWILDESPIANKIWGSGKLDVSLFTESEIEEIKQKFES